MLILSRRIGESLIINDDIIITITGIQNNQTRIGIKAPRSINIYREEIYEQAIKENAF